MAKIKSQKTKPVKPTKRTKQTKQKQIKKVEEVEIALPATRKSDDPIPRKVNIYCCL